MKIFNIFTVHSYLSFILLFLVFGNACAYDSSAALHSIIQDAINTKSQPAHRVSLRKIFNWSDSCEKRFNYPTSGLTFFKQSDNLYIVQVMCTYGSYQGMSLIYRLNLSQSTPTSSQINFPVYSSNNKSDTEFKDEIWGNVLTTSTLNNFKALNLYSGHGHCGSLTTYDLAGNQAKIIQLKMEPDCDEKEKVRDPEKWNNIKIK